MRSAGSRLVALAVLCVVVAFILWKSADRPKPPVFSSDAVATPTPEPPLPPPPPDPTPQPVVAQATPPATPLPVAVQSLVPATPIPPRIAARMERAAAMPSAVSTLPPGRTPMEELVQSDMNHLLTAFRDYAFAFDGHPVGNNAEITKALMGGNDKGIRFPLPEGSTVNNKGEMCDRWGSPYFFHQLSKKKMEVRSAGPDREMWTGDDLQR